MEGKQAPSTIKPEEFKKEVEKLAQFGRAFLDQILLVRAYYHRSPNKEALAIIMDKSKAGDEVMEIINEFDDIMENWL